MGLTRWICASMEFNWSMGLAILCASQKDPEKFELFFETLQLSKEDAGTSNIHP